MLHSRHLFMQERARDCSGKPTAAEDKPRGEDLERKARRYEAKCFTVNNQHFCFIAGAKKNRIQQYEKTIPDSAITDFLYSKSKR